MPGRIPVLDGPISIARAACARAHGRTTLAESETRCRADGKGLGLEMEGRQSNSGPRWSAGCGRQPGDFDAVTLNAGAYSHTSIPLLVALRSLNKPLIDVHLSNIYW